MVAEMDPTKVGRKVGVEIWRVNQFRLEEVPRNEYGAFYSGDCYVVLNTKNCDEWDVHFWLGRKATQDEQGAAAIKAVEIDTALGGFPVQYREVQGYESPLFISYFPDGIRYLEGGHETGYKHIEEMFAKWTPQLFHCKGKRNIRCYQVKCVKESLNQGDVFILDLGKDIYVWMPPESGRLERIKAMTRAKNMAEHERQGASKVHIIDDDWNTNPVFWSHFGGKNVIGWIKGAKDDDEDFWKQNNIITLWKVSDATGKINVNQIASGDIPQKLLDSKDAFVLDAGMGGVFVWIGKECTQEERSKAMEIGAKYLHQRKLPDFTVLTRVLETAEPSSFTQWFGDWEGAKKKKTFEPKLYQVSDESGKIVMEEIVNYDQECLDGDDVMILDAMNIIYVWVGQGANKNEKNAAENTAKKFLAQSQLPRKKPTIETIMQGQETPTFKKFFPEWDDKMFKKMDISPGQLLAMYMSDLPWNLFLTSTAIHAVALITSPLQAVYKWFRRKSSDSDTCIPYVCAVVGSSLWWRYSVFLRDTKLILLQSYAMAMQFFFLACLVYYRSKKRRLVRATLLVFFFLFGLFYYVGSISEEDGRELMGQIASAAQIAGSFVCPYLIYKAISSRCIDFVPLAPVAFTWVMEAHAIIYSVGIDDFYMMLANTIFFCMDGSLLSMFFIFPREKPEKSAVLVQ